MTSPSIAPIPSSQPLTVQPGRSKTPAVSPVAPKDQHAETTSQLRLLLNGVKSIGAIGTDSKTIVESSLERLNVAGVDYQGQLSCAYGQSGGAAGIEFTVDLASLIPFLDYAGIELEVGFGADITYLKESILVMLRFPKSVNAPSTRSSSSEVQPSRTDSDEVGNDRKTGLSAYALVGKKGVETHSLSELETAQAHSR